MVQKLFRKQDIVLILTILMIAAAFFGVNQFLNRKPAAVVKIIVDAEIVEELALDRDKEIVLSENGEHQNTVVVDDGFVFMKDASCPDKVCMHQGRISETGEMIVCLPNLTIVRIDANTDS